jgi:maltose alpha-D-glucosyltransferase/alpha-amylase
MGITGRVYSVYACGDENHLPTVTRQSEAERLPVWLSQAVFYQIYPQSFCDSDGDGIGDISGIVQKLDYLQWLGVNALWLNPCFVSPFRDGGYDVADYYRVAPRYGTNQDLYRLCREAHRRGIRVCLDLVAGHTSIDHPWFKSSCQPRRSKYSDRYIWAPSPPSAEAGVPLSFIRGYSEREGSYVANFFYFQPALNYGFAKPCQSWQQPVDAPGPLETRKELVKIMTYWLGHGVDGFRVDMASSLIKMDPDHTETIKLWQDIGREVRALYPDMALIAEWGNPGESIAAGFDIDFMFHIGVPGYADLILNEKCFFRRHGGGNIQPFLRGYLEQAAKAKGKGLISIPSGNHDIKRPRADGRTLSDLKVIFTFLLTWPGVPFIYYGDEIGMRYLPGMASKENGYGRTGSRTPMQWDDGPNSGFSAADKNQLYLPLDAHRNCPTVEKQAGDPGSLLNHVRHLIALRKRSSALQAEGTLISLPVEDNERHFAYLRQAAGERFLIALNPSAKPSAIRVGGARPEAVSPRICHGAQARVEGEDVRIDLAGGSYGVFRL